MAAYKIILIGLGLTPYGIKQSAGNKGKDGSGGSVEKPEDPIATGKRIIRPKPMKRGTEIPDGFGGKEFATVKIADTWLNTAEGRDFKKFYRIVLLGSVHKS